MITSYNKYESSIYTQNDIDNILDKGAQNFTDSDIAILTSYSTGDERIKELIEIIKSYREKFLILNVEIKKAAEENNGEKPDELFDQWMKLHRELSKYENELEYKFKVTDNDYRYDKLDKLRGRVNESFRFFNSNDKLEYMLVQPKFKIGDTVIFKPDALNIHMDNIPYVDDDRTKNWILMNKGNKLQIRGFAYEENLNLWLLDVCTENSLTSYFINQDSLIKYGPNYNPRKINRTLESNSPNYRYFCVKVEDREELNYLLDMLKKISPELVNQRLFYDMEFPNWIFLDTEKNEEEKYHNAVKWDKVTDEDGLNKYLDRTANVMKKIFTIRDLHAIRRLIIHSGNEPSYEPRKITRTLEANNFEQTLIKKIQSVLTKDLLIPEWAKKLEQGKHHPFAGHCYAASEALYHLLGGKEKGYKPMRGKGLNNETHWWIVDKEGNKLDPTAEQFYFVGLKPPYEAGKGSGFLTKNPSKRAKEIISRIQNI